MREGSFFAETLVALLKQRATEQPNRVAYRFCAKADGPEEELTYSALCDAAHNIAHALIDDGASGGRVVLFDTSGLDFVRAFFGILCAGAVAVPLAPPHPTRSAARLTEILADIQATHCVGSKAIVQRVARLQSVLPGLAQLRLSDCDALIACASSIPSDSIAYPFVADDELAILQYTSGSTSAPKGVAVTHRNFIENALRVGARMAVSERTVAVSWLPLYHDMGLMNGVILPLVGGYPVVMMPPARFSMYPLEWLRMVSRFRATMTGAPNFAYDACVGKGAGNSLDGIDLSSLELAFCGAEPIRADTLRRFSSSFKSVGFRDEAFFPCYGLAEATLFVAGGPAGRGMQTLRAARRLFELHGTVVSPDDREESIEFVSCGCPAAGQRLVIVDPSTRKVLADRQVGEIWVQGPSIAQGYLNRPAEAETMFRAFLAGNLDGPFLRTGDLGFLADGQLIVTGRLKELLIVHGENHYPQDIERSVERSHPALREHAGAACVRHTDRADETLLIVHEIRRRWVGDAEDVIRKIRGAVAEEHGVAVASIVLVKQGSIPMTTSGKIQRAAVRTAFHNGTLDILAQWHTEGVQDASAAYGHTTTSRGDVLTLLANIWREVLHVSDIAASSHFFELGGDSLAVTAMTARIRALWGIRINPDQVFRTPTFAAFATNVECLVGADPLHMPAQSLEPAREDVQEAPLGQLQSSIWLDAQIGDKRSAYHIAVQLILSGPLDAVVLSSALSEVVRRHGILRTRFYEKDATVRQRVVSASRIELNVFESCESAVFSEMEAFASEQFDLAAEGPCRFRLWHIGPMKHRLAIIIHHLAADGWSIRHIVEEMSRCYAALIQGTELPFSEPAPQYLDWVTATDAVDEDFTNRLEYWRRVLTNSPERLAMPADYLREGTRSLRGGSIAVHVDARRLEALRTLAQAEGVTLYMLLLATFQLHLSRWSGDDDIIIGSPFANRPTVPTERIVGLFANMVALRVDLSGDPTFSQLLARVRDSVFAAQLAGSVPLDRIIAELDCGSAIAGRGIFQGEFILQPGLSAIEPVPGLQISADLIDTQTCKYDFAISLFVQDEEVKGTFSFSLDLFASATMLEFVQQWQALLDEVVSTPHARLSDMHVQMTEACSALLNQWSMSQATEVPDTHLFALFDAQARRTPNAFALIQGDSRLTFSELANGARRIAQTLLRAGVTLETRVGLCLERSPHAIVALLGILAAGGAYVPLEPELPRQRLEFILENSSVTHVFVDSSTAHLLHGCPVEQIDVATALSVCDDENAFALPLLQGDNLAYIVYTSGSTGMPKGVAGCHASTLNYLLFIVKNWGLNAQDVVMNVSPLGFDASLRDIFCPLSVGATLVLVPAEDGRNPARYRDQLTRSNVTYLLSGTPSFLRAICSASNESAPHLKAILASGEVLDRHLCTYILNQLGDHVAIFNQYGPTECTMTSTWTDALRATGERIPIGRPLANVFVRVLDAAMRPVPPFVPGELYIGGSGLTRGYIGRPDLTAERFVPDPFGAGGRLYRTGDRVRWRADGQLEFLGRIDTQLKIRGVRIETDEIETALSRHPNVQQAAVAPKHEISGDVRLIAYVSSKRGALDAAELRRFLRLSLPGYAVPNGFVQLPELPLTITGKVDRRAMAALDVPLLHAEYRAPETEVEQQLVTLLSELLDVASIGMTDNFFILGGHSLMATRVLARVRERFGVDISIREFFEKSTLGELAADIEARRQAVVSS